MNIIQLDDCCLDKKTSTITDVSEDDMNILKKALKTFQNHKYARIILKSKNQKIVLDYNKKNIQVFMD